MADAQRYIKAFFHNIHFSVVQLQIDTHRRMSALKATEQRSQVQGSKGYRGTDAQ